MPLEERIALHRGLAEGYGVAGSVAQGPSGGTM
jgi:hypothetical protein